MHKPQFGNGHFYHVYNRGVEKRLVFLDSQDYFRAIHDLFEFNNTAPAGKFFLQSEVEPPILKKSRDLLVKIHCFCLMPNHYHFLLEQIQDGGIVKFMKKFGTGYTMYFNERRKRVGPLFQGRFKAILIEKDEYLTHLSRYIHLNPVELIEPQWKENGIKNWNNVGKFLKSYRWSSYLDYIGKKNFPSLITMKFIQRMVSLKNKPSPEEYRKFTREWIAQDMSVNDIILE
jgi:putative transposase